MYRKTEIERACELLGINGEGTAAQESRMVGLVGPGGAGKSTVASMVIHSAHVQAHFQKGVLWLPVGQGAANRLSELLLDLAIMVWETVLPKCVRAPEKGGAVVKPEDGAEYIRGWVDEGSRSFLVVADDVWENEVLEGLGKAGVWVLYTSRCGALSESVVWFNRIGDEEAETVLKLAAELEESQRLPDAAHQLILKSECVMDLAFVGRWSIVHGRTDAKAWQKAVDRIVAFQNGGAEGEKPISWRTAVLHAGYEELGRMSNNQVSDLYLSLAVLPKGLAFAEKVAAVLLYGKDYSTDDLTAATKLSATLERFSILTLEDGGTHRVHDEHADFIRKRITNSPELRKGALGVWRQYAASKHAVLTWTEKELVKIWRDIDELEGTGITPRPFAMVLDTVDRSEYLIVLEFLLSFYDRRRQPAKALDNAREMLAIEESELGPNNPGIVATLECAGKCARLAGLEDEANEYLQRAQAIQEITPCRSDKEARETSTIEDDKPFLRRALAVRMDSLHADHPHIAITYCELGVGALRAGNPEEAEKSLQQALRICERQGADSIEITRPLHWIGVLHLEIEQIDSAVDYLQRALEIREERLGPNHPDVADTVHKLGQCALKAEKEQEAGDLFLRALKIREDFEGSATVV